MIKNFKNILKQATDLEKTLFFDKETLAWPWPELIVKKTKLKKIKLADFLSGFTNLPELYQQGVKIRLAQKADYEKIAGCLSSSYHSYSKIELRQLALSQADIIITIPSEAKITIAFKNKIFSSWGNIYFFIGANASVTIIDDHQLKNDFEAGSVYLLSNNNSQVEYLSLAGRQSYNFNLRSYPGESSCHYLYSVGKMSEKYYYYNIMSFLAKTNGQNHILASLSFLNQAKSLVKLQNKHITSGTTGDIKFKGIGWHNSQSKIDGLIEIHKKASQTNSYLKADIILASASSYIKTEPNLEILNNDVKASHGATIGSLDNMALFYLMSRGLSSDQAQKLMTDGFLKSWLKDIMSLDIKNALLKYWL